MMKYGKMGSRYHRLLGEVMKSVNYTSTCMSRLIDKSEYEPAGGYIAYDFV